MSTSKTIISSTTNNNIINYVHNHDFQLLLKSPSDWLIRTTGENCGAKTETHEHHQVKVKLVLYMIYVLIISKASLLVGEYLPQLGILYLQNE